MVSQTARHRFFLGSLVTVVWLCGIAPSSAEWRRIDSPNFTVIGDVGARTLRDVAVKFEGFRETLSRVLTERATSTAVPTIVIVFPTDRAFTPFKPLYQGKPIGGIAGLFVPREDANYIAVVAQGEEEGMRVVFHEYAHLVVSNMLRHIPPWLNEGLAEFYSTYDVSSGGREALIGRPIVYHLQELNESSMLKLDDLINVDYQSPLYNERNRRSVFYAQSWALTHRLLLGEPKRTAELWAYLERITEGSKPTDAWQKAFGAANVERELQQYVRSQSYRAVKYKFSEKLASFDAVPSSLSAADAEAFLADFLYQQGRLDEALVRTAAAEKFDPGNQRALAIRSLIQIAKGEREVGAKQLMAISKPNDWLIAYTAGTGLVESIESRRETPTAEQMQAVRAMFDYVRQHHGELPNVNARWAMLELRAADGPTKDGRLAIERARMMVPGREDYAFVHAQVLARMKEYLLARNVIAPLMSVGYPAHVREPARELMRYILELEDFDKKRAEAASPSAAPDAAANDAAAESKPSPGAPRPIFRELKDGEQRLEGVLERIECRTRGAATFHIRTDAGVETVTTQRMTGVEFISYRTDLTGTVTCGPLKSPLPVIATWRFDPLSKEPKTAVALEFPPK
jgi:uncharacterized protein DUF1570